MADATSKSKNITMIDRRPDRFGFTVDAKIHALGGVQVFDTEKPIVTNAGRGSPFCRIVVNFMASSVCWNSSRVTVDAVVGTEGQLRVELPGTAGPGVHVAHPSYLQGGAPT